MKTWLKAIGHTLGLAAICSAVFGLIFLVAWGISNKQTALPTLIITLVVVFGGLTVLNYHDIKNGRL